MIKRITDICDLDGGYLLRENKYDNYIRGHGSSHSQCSIHESYMNDLQLFKLSLNPSWVAHGP